MVPSAAAMETGGQVPDVGRALVPVVTTSTTAGGAAREPERLPCPRCESTDTKFCYYNNYNLAQPRYFCRTCRRYWTRGGALRNVPVGGGTRKATTAGAAARRKRSGAGAAPAPTSVPSAVPVTALPTSALPAPLHGGGSMLRPYVGGGGVGGMSSFAAPAALASSPLTAVDPAGRLLDFGGSFTSLIAPGVADVGGVHFSAGFLLAGGLAPAALQPRAPAGSVAALPPPPPQQQQPTVSQALPEGVFWSMGWPDLSI